MRPFADPLYPEGSMAFLRGNLAPNGAIIKQSAASQTLMQHKGRAVVFRDAEDLARRIDDPDLNVGPEDILVLQRIGPKGGPGMPEAGYLPIPRKLARQGVTDMVRISDGRMSGTAAGTIVLHVSPEAAEGGPLALVRDGDLIRLDVKNRRLDLLIDDSELEQRQSALGSSQASAPMAGHRHLFMESVLQAEDGCDFTFSAPTPTETVPRP